MLRHYKRGIAKLHDIRCRTVSLTDFREYVAIRGRHAPLLLEFYAKRHFRQWKWNTFQLVQTYDGQIVNKLRRHFGPDRLFIISDHSSPHMRHHAPVRGIGMKRMLQRNIRIAHVDEYQTSHICPCCDGKTGLSGSERVRDLAR